MAIQLTVAATPKKLLECVTLENVSVKEIIGAGTFSSVNEAGVVLFDDSEGIEVMCVARRFREVDTTACFERLERVCRTLWQPGRGKIDHTNIVRFMGLWFQPTTDLPWLLSEKMDISLANYLHRKQKPENTTYISLLRDVANGLEFLHDPQVQAPIIHGDLTANNVFICESAQSDSVPQCIPVAKIGDLGVREILGKGVCPSCSSYRSPEAHKANHTPCVADDIYSLGVMIIHTLLQEYPEDHQLSGNSSIERFSGYLARLSAVCQPGNQIVYDCVCDCLKNDPDHRPQAYVIFGALGGTKSDEASAPVTLQNLKRQATTQDKLKQRVESTKPIRIFVTGKTGSGKSSLINGLVGKDVTDEGHLLTSSTKEAKGFEFLQGSVQFLVVDSPGLQDHEQDDKVTLKMISQQLKSICKSFDLVIYCIDMTSKRVEASDKKAIQQLTRSFNESIWKNAVFLLTFANKVEPPPSYDEGDDVEWYKKRLNEFQDLLRKTLVEARVSREVANEVPIIPTGYYKISRNIQNPWKLPDRSDWFNIFWIGCALRMEGGASAALFKSQETRISREPLPEITGTSAERKIFVPPEYVPVKDAEGIYIPRVRVVASSFVGSVIGGSVGALFGIAGGPVGIAVVAVAGAATGAVVGGAVGAAATAKVCQQ